MLAKVQGNNKEEQTDERKHHNTETHDRYLTSVIMCSETVCNIQNYVQQYIIYIGPKKEKF